jgi:hypothetical protein
VAEKRRSWIARLWDDVRPNWAFWLMSTPLFTAATAFVPVAKKIWDIEPVWASIFSGSLAASFVGLALMWRGKPAWDAESGRRARVRHNLEGMSNLRNSADYLVEHPPSREDGRAIGAWLEKAQNTIDSSAWWHSPSSNIPHDIRTVIANPAVRPSSSAVKRGDKLIPSAGDALDDRAQQLRVIVRGFEEAMRAYSARERVTL